jgi:hypothetical protein
VSIDASLLCSTNRIQNVTIIRRRQSEQWGMAQETEVRGGYSPLSTEPEVYTTREHSKTKQDNTFCRDYLVFTGGLFVFIITTVTQYPEFEISIMGYCPISRDSEPNQIAPS